MYTLVFSLFVVLINETDGNDVQTGIETECEKHKQYIIRATSTGMRNFEEQFNTIIAAAETEDEVHKLVEEELNQQYDGLENYNNPFQSWAQEIYEKSKRTVTEGTGINPMYLPTLVPLIIKCFKLLPLWSGIMIPVFGYGDEIASSAAVESSFNKIKNITFKHNPLPTDIESFLEHHIASLRGASLLRSSQQTTTPSPSLESNLNDLDNICVQEFQEISDTNCPLCKTGNLPSENGLHKCTVCNVPVHALSSCSTHIPGEEERRVCLMCSKNTLTINSLTNEDVSVESWKRQRLQKSRSYLYPNSSLQHLRINNTKNIRSLPILKNGSRADELKSCTVENIGKVIMSNTCAFDTIASILMVSYSDSIEYGNKVDSCNNTFLTFVAGLVRDGVTASTYSDRAEIMMKNLQLSIQVMAYNVNLATCDTTAEKIITSLMCDLPTGFDIVLCSDRNCERIKNTPIPILMFTTENGKLDGLQEFLNLRIKTTITKCGYMMNMSNPCNGQKHSDYPTCIYLLKY